MRVEKPHKIAGDERVAATAAAAPTTLMTVTEREALEKTQLIAKKIKIPRYVDRPYDDLYPVIWIAMLETKSPEDIYTAWRTRMDLMFQNVSSRRA